MLLLSNVPIQSLWGSQKAERGVGWGEVATPSQLACSQSCLPSSSPAALPQPLLRRRHWCAQCTGVPPSRSRPTTRCGQRAVWQNQPGVPLHGMAVAPNSTCFTATCPKALMSASLVLQQRVQGSHLHLFLTPSLPTLLQVRISLRSQPAPTLNLTYYEPPLQSICHSPTLPSLPQVRISLDSELHMVREEAAPHAPGDWCRYARGAPLANSALVKKYPYSKSRRFSPSAPPKHCSGLGHI